MAIRPIRVCRLSSIHRTRETITRRRATITCRRATRRETRDKKFNMLNFCLRGWRQSPRQSPAVETVCRFAADERQTGRQNRKILSPALSRTLSPLFCLSSAGGLSTAPQLRTKARPTCRMSIQSVPQIEFLATTLTFFMIRSTHRVSRHHTQYMVYKCWSENTSLTDSSIRKGEVRDSEVIPQNTIDC